MLKRSTDFKVDELVSLKNLKMRRSPIKWATPLKKSINSEHDNVVPHACVPVVVGQDLDFL